jgi:DNA primase
MKVVQAEHACVALMGCSLSNEQEDLLVSHFPRVAIMLDGDEAGRAASAEIASRLVAKLWVRVSDAGERMQPDQLSIDEIQALLRQV